MNNDWISVKDKMPEFGQTVLAVISSYDDPFIEVLTWELRRWTGEVSRDEKEVSYWQPLPELPKQLSEYTGPIDTK